MATQLNTTTLVLGGARSGKSRFALEQAESLSASPVYIATAEAGDAEMAQRISLHRQQRGQHWSTFEVPLALSEALVEQQPGTTVVVDCLTLWLSNHLLRGSNLEAETAGLLDALRNSTLNLFLVSNEVGMGLVPETPLGRSFRDAQGRLNQQVAQAADRVYFIAAGLPLSLKGPDLSG